MKLSRNCKNLCKFAQNQRNHGKCVCC